jgi:regulatory protein
VPTGGEKLAIVTSLSERIAAAVPNTPAAVPRANDHPSRGGGREARGGFDPISNVAMHALARRGMSSSELRSYLVQREFDPSDADGEIDRLERVGLLDDLQLAETLVTRLRERKGLGRAGLKAELARRRLDPDAIGAALEAIDDDEHGAALEVAQRRAPQLRVYDQETAMRRLVSFLQRKGYSYGIAARAAQIALTPGSGNASGGPAFR